jgi:hypothetical protein
MTFGAGPWFEAGMWLPALLCAEHVLSLCKDRVVKARGGGGVSQCNSKAVRHKQVVTNKGFIKASVLASNVAASHCVRPNMPSSIYCGPHNAQASTPQTASAELINQRSTHTWSGAVKL